MNKTIMLVEDDPAIREMMLSPLQRAGFMAEVAEDVSEAEVIIRRQNMHLILLDWMLPGVSGVEFARKLRANDETRGIPIIMLTARSEEDDRLSAFEAGADDYVAKPFSVRELIARIKAVLRRATEVEDEELITVNGLTLNPVTHRVTCEGCSVNFGPTDFRLLHFLMLNPERVFSRGQLMSRVWGSGIVADERTVDTHIRGLRKALSVHGYDGYIQTVHRTGYRFSSRT